MSRSLDKRALLRVGIGAAVAAVVILLPFLLQDRYVLRILTLVGINVIIVVGLSLLFGFAGQISLGHAAFYGLGAYTSGYLTKVGLAWPLALLAGVGVAALGGLLLALPSLRLKGHYLAMATLGFGEIALFFFSEGDPITGGSNGLRQIPPASIGPLTADTPATKYMLVWAIACMVLLLAGNLVKRRPGRALRAIHGSEIGAQACGVDTVRMKVQVFVLSAALGGLAGVLYAHYVGFVSPSTFSITFSIGLVAMVALGGMGSLAGAVAGTVLLTLLPYADAIIPGLSRETVETLQSWETDIYGIVLILVMLFMPKGLAGFFRGALATARSRRTDGRAAREGASA